MSVNSKFMEIKVKYPQALIIPKYCNCKVENFSYIFAYSRSARSEQINGILKPIRSKNYVMSYKYCFQ